LENAEIKYRKWARRVLVVVGLLTIFFLWKTASIKFSYDFEAFFPNDGRIEQYNNYKDSFLTETEPIWIGIPLGSNLFESDNIARLKLLDSALRTDTNILRVQSITTLKIPVSTGIGVIFDRYIHHGQVENYRSDSIRIAQSPMLMGSFVSEDFQHVSVLIQTRYDLDKDLIPNLANTVESSLQNAGFSEYHIVGRLIDQSHIVDHLLREMILFIGLSALIVCLALAFFYRNLWSVLVPFSVVSLSAIWLLGIMSSVGKDIDVLMTLVPTILFIVGVSDIIHLLTRYLEVLSLEGDKFKALKLAFKEVGWATLITSLTTSIGFLSLLTSPVAPVRSFGLYTALGVLLAYVLAFSIFPSFLLLAPKEMFARSTRIATSHKSMHRLFSWVLKNRRLIMMTALGITILSVALVPRIKPNSYFTEELPKNDPIRKAFDYMEAHFAGVRGIEVSLRTKDGSELTELRNLRQIVALEEHLDTQFLAGSLISPSTNMKLCNQIAQGGNPSKYGLPVDSSELVLTLPFYRKIKNRSEKRFVLNSNNTFGRITGQMPDIGGYAFLKRMENFEQVCAEHASNLEVSMTGLPYLLDLNNRNISKSLIQGIALAFLIVSLLMAFLYKDPVMVLLALIPNILPLLLVGLLMVLTGTDLNVTTSLFFTVIFGIAVDDTIHVLSKMKIELEKGKSRIYAVKRAMISTGKALVLTSIILCLGFITLIFSNFNSSFLFGALVSTGLILALIIDLTVLPILLISAKRK